MKNVIDHEQAFKNAEIKLNNLFPGMTILNPCDFKMDKTNPSYEDYIKRDIYELIECDAIYMLKNWEQSNGSFCEWVIAKTIGLKILYEG